MSTPIRLLIPFAGLFACVPWPPFEGCIDAGCTTETTTSTGDVLPTSTDGGIQTVTGEQDSPSSTAPDAESGAETDINTTGEPAQLPVIVTVELKPDPIQFNGLITLTITTEYADGVRMALDSGDPIELTSSERGLFSGEISVLTGLKNGPRVALLTPHQGEFEGQAVAAPYTIDLPTPGSQGFWETGDLIGTGQVAAMATLPTGEVIELGTHFDKKANASRCYLRRRDKAGAWGPDDLVTILPDSDCTAIDLKVDDQGAMFVVVHRHGLDGTRWWLAKIPAWGLGATNLGIGAKDESAVALAHHASGTVAVCGSAPTPSTDVDAAAWIFRPNLPGETRAFDYQGNEGEKPAHSFDERTRDCAFTGDTLALVGEANGVHGEEKVPRNRLFILRLETAANTPAWTVAPSGVKTQSGAQAVASDDQDRLVLAGYTCDDACKPEGDLRIYDTQGDLASQVSLGLFPNPQFGAQDLAWSPAGYAVVATGGMVGNEAAFTVRAFVPAKVEPAWTFTREDNQLLHMALALAIGPFGEVYAGGLGANGFPAVAYIGG